MCGGKSLVYVRSQKFLDTNEEKPTIVSEYRLMNGDPGSGALGLILQTA